MTQATAKKLATLTSNTEKYLPKIKAKDSLFATSAAKYYPALKNLPLSETYRLSAAVIEAAHGTGIGMLWPGIEPVEQSTCLDVNLLYSAEKQPYQYCFGQELYPTLEAKAAYLFYHLTTAHIFGNGNKRTAVLCVDTFLLINGFFLVLSNEEVYDLAKEVAASGGEGRHFQEVFHSIRVIVKDNMVPLSAIRKVNPRVYRKMHKRKWALREWEINRSDAPLRQR